MKFLNLFVVGNYVDDLTKQINEIFGRTVRIIDPLDLDFERFIKLVLS